MSTAATDIAIREFLPGDEAAFQALNEEWIVRYFKLEEKDRYSFANPQATILDRGGRIFFVLQNGKPIGCCALLSLAANEFEVGKMAVTASAQGNGIGRRMLAHVIAEAAKAGAKRLYLETNHSLTPAMRIYEALGFRHVPAERLVPSAYNRADVFMELFL